MMMPSMLSHAAQMPKRVRLPVGAAAAVVSHALPTKKVLVDNHKRTSAGLQNGHLAPTAPRRAASPAFLAKQSTPALEAAAAIRAGEVFARDSPFILRRKTDHLLINKPIIGAVPSAQRGFSDAAAAMRAVDLENRELKQKLLDMERVLQQRDRLLAYLQDELARALAQLEAKNAIQEPARQDIAVKEDDEEREELLAPTDAASEWVFEIVHARETLGAVAMRNKEIPQLLLKLTHRLESICNGADVTSFDLTSIAGVLRACGLRQLSTPGTGNCQFYAFIEAATQYSFYLLQQAVAVAASSASSSSSSSSAVQLLACLENATAAMKRGIRGSAMLSFAKTFSDEFFLGELVKEVNRTQLDEAKSPSSRRDILRGYFNDIASNSSSVDVTVSPSEWGTSLTLHDGTKSLGRPVYVLSETAATPMKQQQVNFQRYAPTDPTGVGSMYVSCENTHMQSFAQWAALLLEDLKASKGDSNTAPLVVMLNHYSAIVVDDSATFLEDLQPLPRDMQFRQQLQEQQPQDEQPEQVQVQVVVGPSPVPSRAPKPIRSRVTRDQELRVSATRPQATTTISTRPRTDSVATVDLHCRPEQHKIVPCGTTRRMTVQQQPKEQPVPQPVRKPISRSTRPAPVQERRPSMTQEVRRDTSPRVASVASASTRGHPAPSIKGSVPSRVQERKKILPSAKPAVGVASKAVPVRPTAAVTRTAIAKRTPTPTATATPTVTPNATTTAKRTVKPQAPSAAAMPRWR